MDEYRCGIDNIDSQDRILKGKRLALITNPTGLNKDFVSTIDVLRSKYKLVRLLSPEHGVRGDIQAGLHVASYTDGRSGLECVSIYANDIHRALKDIECVVFDIQDIGVRYYTYLYTMTDTMLVCKELGIPMVVLDRYDPLGRSRIEGAILHEAFSSFVGRYAVPVRYAMTIGEFATYINSEMSIGCDLYVSKCSNILGASPDWVMPSPNMSSCTAALCYVGTCLFEGTNISEGRGTVRPFEIFGAPWLKAESVISELNKEYMAGCRLRPMYFTPMYSKYKCELCSGIQIHVTDKEVFKPFALVIALLDLIRSIHKEFEFLKPSSGDVYFIDHLLGSDELRKKEFDVKTYLAGVSNNLLTYEIKRDKYRLY